MYNILVGGVVFVKKINMLIIIITMICCTPTVLGLDELPQDTNQFYLNFNLEFFNQFNTTGNRPLTEAFQRYHMLTAGYRWSDWDFQLIYNWYDQVNSETSVHTITPWGFVIKRNLNEQQHIDLNYWFVHDVFGKNETKVVRIEYYRQIPLGEKCVGDIRIGGKLLDNSQIYPIFGGQITYLEHYHLGFNYLKAIDAHLLDELDGELSLPINIGVTYPLNEHNRIKMDYYKCLKNPSRGLDQWFVTSLEFKLWD